MKLAQLAFDVAQTLSACETQQGLSQRFAEAISHVGLSASACGMVTGAKATSGNPFHFTNWPAGWLKLYLDEGFARRDPLPRWALISGQPVTWSFVKASLQRNDPGHRLYRLAEEWGFTEGMAVPVRSHGGALGLVSSGGNRAELNSQEATFITTISTAVFHRADALCPSTLPADVLPLFSQRETEIVALLHQGFTDKELSQILGVSIETVRSHVLNARLKVGARSRTHLVALTSQAPPTAN